MTSFAAMARRWTICSMSMSWYAQDKIIRFSCLLQQESLANIYNNKKLLTKTKNHKQTWKILEQWLVFVIRIISAVFFQWFQRIPRGIGFKLSFSYFLPFSLSLSLFFSVSSERTKSTRSSFSCWLDAWLLYSFNIN